jgi:hypothetical protein
MLPGKYRSEAERIRVAAQRDTNNTRLPHFVLRKLTVCKMSGRQATPLGEEC